MMHRNWLRRSCPSGGDPDDDWRVESEGVGALLVF
jgi:hypothetical protein